MESGPQPAIRVSMMPRDLNAHGTIFGGIILSYIDQAGAIEAYQRTDKKLVTVAIHEVKFIAPVFVGDLVSFYAETMKNRNDLYHRPRHGRCQTRQPAT